MPAMVPPTFVLGLALAHAAVAVAAAGGMQTPNVLMMVIDDLGFNDLGFSQVMHGYNAPGTLTPTIDALATNGLRSDH